MALSCCILFYVIEISLSALRLAVGLLIVSNVHHEFKSYDQDSC